MGLRAARTSLVAITAFCVLAVPVAALAKAPEDKPEHGHGKPAASDTSSPQPKSHADLNKGGANNGGDCGAYCSTRDGSPSRNGKGDGQAKGKPCAGCVGKADNKNPKGQAPDGTDHNAGYECDRNQGIGQTNPAHTGCTATATPTPTPTETEPGCVPTEDEPCEPGCVPTEDEPCEPECVPTEDEPCETPTPTPSVEPTETVKPSETPSETPSASISPEVRGIRFTRHPETPTVSGSLPMTGTNVSVALLLLAGFGLVALGAGVTVATPDRRG
jgi:hypothetical protein